MRLARLAGGLAVVAALAGCAAATSAGDRTEKPGQAAAVAATPTQPPTRGAALVNPGFESAAVGNRSDPPGWFTFQHAGAKSYDFTLDTAEPRSGARSLRIDNVGSEPYGAIAQAMDAKPYRGKVARLSAWLRTRDASDGGAVLTLVMLQSGALVAHNFMAEAPVKGTTGWQRYTITLPVPQSAERMEVGAMLQGKGTLWLDDVELAFE